MDGLRVRPADLTAYGAQLGRAASATAACRRYLDEHGTVPGWPSGGLFNLALANHGSMVDRVRGVLSRLADVLEESRSALENAAKYYRAVERQNAAKFDAELPRMERPIDPGTN